MSVAVRQKAHGIITATGQTLAFPAQTLSGSVVVVMLSWGFYVGSFFPTSDDAGNNTLPGLPLGNNSATTVDGPPATVGAEAFFTIFKNPDDNSNFCRPLQTVTFTGSNNGPVSVWMFELTGMQYRFHGVDLWMMDAQQFTEQSSFTSQNCLNNSAQNPMYSPAGTAYGGSADTHSQILFPSDSTRQYFIVTCCSPTGQGGGGATIASVDTPFTLEPVQNGFGCAWKITSSGYDIVADRAVFHNGAPAFFSAIWISLAGAFVPPPGQITVNKTTVPSGSPQAFTVRPSWSAPLSMHDGDSVASGPLISGTYSISEDAATGWLPQITVSNGNQPSAIVVNNGDNIVVSILNAQTAPSPPGGDHFIPSPGPVAGPVQNIPLDNAPNQTWEVTVNVDGQPLTFSVILRYNEIAKYWAATILDSDGNLMLDSVPFVTGDGISQNLLEQFAYLGLGSATVFNASASV